MNLIIAVRLLIKPNFMKNDLKQADSLFSKKIISWYAMDGIEFLISKLKNTKNNADFFDSMNKTAN